MSDMGHCHAVILPGVVFTPNVNGPSARMLCFGFQVQMRQEPFLELASLKKSRAKNRVSSFQQEQNKQSDLILNLNLDLRSFLASPHRPLHAAPVPPAHSFNYSSNDRQITAVKMQINKMLSAAAVAAVGLSTLATSAVVLERAAGKSIYARHLGGYQGDTC